jgi:hypothetical protein
MATALAQLNSVHAGQQAYVAIIATMPPCAVKSRFVCGFPVGLPPESRLVGFLWASWSLAIATRATTNLASRRGG